MKSEIFLYVLLYIVIFIYIFVLFGAYLKRGKQDLVLKKFYKAIVSVYSIKNNIEDSFYQLNIIYEKLCQNHPNKYNNIFDLLKTVLYCYDTYNEKVFKNTFKVEKDSQIRNFIIELCDFINEKDPYISVPLKEASILKTIGEALENNNTQLGLNCLGQLSLEIESKEILIQKKEKENRITTMLTVVGLILTVFFGFLSYIK